MKTYVILDKETKKLVNTVKALSLEDLLESWDYSSDYFEIHEFESNKEASIFLEGQGTVSDASER